MSNKIIHDTEFDHCGVIIKDSVGTPYIYELTLNGPRLRIYSSRIIRSRAKQILAIPLNNSPALSTDKRDRILARLQEKCVHQSSIFFFLSFSKGLISSVLGQFIGSNILDCFYSPEAETIVDALNIIFDEQGDFTPVLQQYTKTKTVTCKTLFEEIDKISDPKKILWIRTK